MLHMALAKWLPTVVDDLTIDATGVTGNVYVGWMPSGPDLAVAVMPSGGDPQLSQIPTDLPVAQFLVRGEREDLAGAYALARSIYSEVTCLDLVTLDDAGDDEVYVVTATALQTDPIPLGQDDNQRFGFSVNVRFRVHAPTAHRPISV